MNDSPSQSGAGGATVQRGRPERALQTLVRACGRADDATLVIAEAARVLPALLPDAPAMLAVRESSAILLHPLQPAGPSVRLPLSAGETGPLAVALDLDATRALPGGPRVALAARAGRGWAGEPPAWLATPLVAGGRPFGALPAGVKDPAAVIPDLSLALEGVALCVALALERTAMLADMRRHGQQSDTLREVVESISSELDLDRLLERIVIAAVDLLGAFGGSIGLARPDGSALELRAAINVQEAIGTVQPAGAGIMGLALRTAAPVVAHDYAEVPEPLPTESFYQLAPWIAAPIIWQGQVTGVFAICAADPSRRFTDGDVSLLTLFAKHAAIAIENAHLYQRSREAAVTEERNRLAREIHDTLAQSLTGIVLQAQAVSDLLEREPDLARGELESLQELARTALEEARRSVWGLHPPVLEEASLAEALEHLLAGTARIAGFSGRFVPQGRARPLTPAIESGVYRIAQEALNNIRHHADARAVLLQLRFEPGELVLVVQDDGVGLEISGAPQDGGGFGLTSMQERARLIGGTLTIASAPGQGVRVEARIPYLASALITPAPAVAHAPGLTNWPVRVLVADDHDVARHGIVRMLETQPDIVVVGEAADGPQTLARARQLLPDVLLLDLQMPGMSGIEVIAALAPEAPSVRPIILTTYAKDDLIMEAIRAGARGFLLKDVDLDELANAIRAVNAGQSLLQPVVATRLVEQIGRMARTPTARESLTIRERDVLRLLVEGARNKEISAALSISHGTVRFHISNIFQKLGVSSRTEAVRLALNEAMLD